MSDKGMLILIKLVEFYEACVKGKQRVVKFNFDQHINNKVL